MKKINPFTQPIKGLFLYLVLVSWIFGGVSCMSKQLPTHGALTKSFHSDSNCNAPCWQNLTPGISTMEDVDQMVLNVSEEEVRSYHRTQIYPDFVKYSWHDEVQGLFVNVSVLRGVVDYIRLSPLIGEKETSDTDFLTPSSQDYETKNNQLNNDSTYAFKYADIFQIIGEPSEYTALLSKDFHGTSLLSIILFYPSGVIIKSTYIEGQPDGFDFGSVGGCSITISPHLPVQELFFTNITALSDTLPGSGSRLAFFNGDIYSWHGLDNIQLSKCND